MELTNVGVAVVLNTETGRTDRALVLAHSDRCSRNFDEGSVTFRFSAATSSWLDLGALLRRWRHSWCPCGWAVCWGSSGWSISRAWRWARRLALVAQHNVAIAASLRVMEGIGCHVELTHIRLLVVLDSEARRANRALVLAQCEACDIDLDEHTVTIRLGPATSGG